MNEENWKAIPGYEDLYEASDLGNIRSLNYGRTGKTRLLSPGFDGHYFRVILCKNGKTKKFSVHNLVITAFRGPIAPGMHVNHLNEDKTDNRLENLEVCTPKQNANWGTRNQRIGQTNRGKKRSDETKAKMCEAQKTRFQLKPHSAETKSKISTSHKGKKLKPLTEEHKTKISNANKGKKRSDETKAKISANEKGNTKRRKALTLIDIDSCGRYRFNSSYQASEFFGYSSVTKIGSKISKAKKLGKNYIVIANRKYRFFQE